MRQYITDVDKAVELFHARLLWRDYNGNYLHPSKDSVYHIGTPSAWDDGDIRRVFEHGGGGSFFVLLEE